YRTTLTSCACSRPPSKAYHWRVSSWTASSGASSVAKRSKPSTSSATRNAELTDLSTVKVASKKQEKSARSIWAQRHPSSKKKSTRFWEPERSKSAKT